MKKVFFLLAIILLVSGQVMCTSCGSSNDEYENKNQPTPPDDNEDPEDPGERPAKDLYCVNRTVRLWQMLQMAISLT